MSKIIGIDLGTTNSVGQLCRWRACGDPQPGCPHHPSVVAIADENREQA